MARRDEDERWSPEMTVVRLTRLAAPPRKEAPATRPASAKTKDSDVVSPYD